MIGCFLLSIIQKRREKTEDEKMPRSSRRTAHKVATFVIFILLINAQYAAAWSLGDAVRPATGWLEEKLKGAYNWLKEGRHLGTAAGAGCFAYAMSSAAAGAVGGSVAPGLGTIAGAVGMALVAGTACYLGGASIENWVKDKFDFFSNDDDSDGDGISILEPRNLSYNEYASRSTLLDVFNTTFVNVSELMQAQAKDFEELKARLAAQLTTYDLEETDGNVGEFKTVTIEGPDKIYGFSAIPVEFTISPRGNTDVKDPICLTNVTLYVYTRDGRTLWTRSWDFQPGEKCGEEGTVWTFETILKGPDPYENQVDAILNGMATWDIVNQIYLATPADEPYEIVAEVNGVRQIYYSTGGEWIFDHNETISARWRTSSAYNHIAAGRIEIGGFSDGTLPVDFKDDPKASMYVPYLMRGSGAASNILARAWVNPLHIINASSTYKIYLGANSQFFNLVSIPGLSVVDDARLVVYRLLKNGQWELATALPISSMAQLGDILSNPTAFEGTVTYHGAEDVVTYMAFIGIKARVVRDDGTEIPIWLLISPNIAVKANEGRVVRLDPTFAQIEDLMSDQEWSAYDAEQAKALVGTIIQELEEKVDSAEHYIETGSQLGNQKVVDYATKAKEHYQEAIEYAKKIPTSEELEDTLRYLEIVRDEEMAGDYYLEAARLASYGANEQAETMAETAEQVADVADQYKPHFGIPGFGDFDLGDLVWWLIALAIVAGVFYVIFGKRAAVLVAVLFLIFAVLDSNLLGAILDGIEGLSLIGKLKFW